MATPNYDVNYEDERFKQVESDKQQAMSEVDKTYDGMINDSDQYYQAQIDASKEWADKQSQIQQEQTDFTIEKIEQQKDQAHKDYLKEQSGAYADWRKQSNQYGSEAEKMASAGLANTGFSESSQVSMYNAYQNRVATARDVVNRAMLNYDNNIKEARLQNSAALAEIAHQALEKQLELGLQGFQYKNQLLLEKSNKKIEVDNIYYNRWQDVLTQINHENAQAEQMRQFEKNYTLQKQQLDEEIRQFNKNYDLKVKEYNEGIRQFNLEIERLKAKDAKEHKLEIQRLELQKKQLQEEKRQFEESQKLKREQLAEEKRQFNAQLAYNKSKSSGSSGSSGSKGGSNKKSKKTITTTYNGRNYKSSGKESARANAENNTKASPKVNMDSVLALGYGPISASRLASLEANGVIQSYVKNGQRYYKNTAITSKLKELYR